MIPGKVASPSPSAWKVGSDLRASDVGAGPPGPHHSRGQSPTAGGEDLMDHVKEEGIALARLLGYRSHASHLWFLFCSLRLDLCIPG